MPAAPSRGCVTSAPKLPSAPALPCAADRLEAPAAAPLSPPAGPASSCLTVQLAGTVSISVACSMTIAATLGGAVPLFFAKIGIDPAVATNPIVTTTTDLVGVTIYFVVGRAFFHL